MNALDIMTTDVVTVAPETEVSEVARLLLAHRISAVPVVDPDGHVVGMVSEADLMRRAECGASRHWWLSLFADSTAEFVRTHGTRARHVMTGEVVSIRKDATLAEIAGLLERRAVKRVPVLDNGRLVGVVSRADVLRGLASLSKAAGQPKNKSDDIIQQQILDLIRKRTLVSVAAVSVIVDDGMVYLWGTVATEEERQAIRVAAESIVGAEKVQDNLNTLPRILQRV